MTDPLRDDTSRTAYPPRVYDHMPPGFEVVPGPYIFDVWSGQWGREIRRVDNEWVRWYDLPKATTERTA